MSEIIPNIQDCYMQTPGKVFDKKLELIKDPVAETKPELPKIDKDFFNSSSSEDDDEPILKKDPETRAKEQMKEIQKYL